MTLIAAIGAAIQLVLLILQKWFQYGDEKKVERKTLYEIGKKAIQDRDPAALTIVFERINRM